MWKGTEWRTMDTMERAQLMGFPRLAVEIPPGKAAHDLTTARANTLVASAGHVPSLMIVLSIAAHMGMANTLSTCFRILSR